jgi:hypothetical protein
MADFGIKPEIALGVKGPTVMSLGDMLNIARGAQSYQREKELYPELIKKTQQEVRSAELGIADKELTGMVSRLSAAINNPMVIKAEEDPNSVDQQKLIQYITTAGRDHAKAMKIDPRRADELLAPIIAVATDNPGMLRGALKEELLSRLDNASRVSTLGGAGAIGVSTIPPNQPAFRGMARPEARQGVTPEAMTAPIGAAVSPVPQPEAQVAPIAQRPVAQPPVAQPPAQPQAAPMMGQGGRVDAGFALPYEPPRPGIPRATMPSESADLATGQKYRTDLLTGQQTVPKATRNVDAVLSGIKELEKDRRFTTGPLASREQYIKEFFGDERFKQLSKDIANVELAVLQASGGSMTTDAGKSLVAKANGDETYPPSVLLSVANRLAGDLTRLDMEARGAQKFAQQFGDSNLPAYRQAWAANADQKIFEAMFLQKNERDPKRQKQALDKILPTSKTELSDFLTKYENIKRLSETGRLK